MVRLASIPKLQELAVAGAGITDAGLVHLRILTRLQGLTSGCSVPELRTTTPERIDPTPTVGPRGHKITDAGLEHLKGLKRLEELDLERTKVTDEGVKRLQKALPNCIIGHY